MSDLSPRGNYTPRRAREQRAYRLAMVGGGASVVAIVGVVLAIIGVTGAGLPVVAAIVAAVCFLLFRRIVSPR